jgi:hypothetical protein
MTFTLHLFGREVISVTWERDTTEDDEAEDEPGPVGFEGGTTFWSELSPVEDR